MVRLSTKGLKVMLPSIRKLSFRRHSSKKDRTADLMQIAQIGSAETATSSEAGESPISLDLHRVASFSFDEASTDTDDLFITEVEEEIGSFELIAVDSTPSPSVEKEITASSEFSSTKACYDEFPASLDLEDLPITEVEEIGSSELIVDFIPSPYVEEEIIASSEVFLIFDESSTDTEDLPITEDEEIGSSETIVDSIPSLSVEEEIAASSELSSTKSCYDESSMAEDSLTTQVEGVECPRLIVDCTPLPSVDETKDTPSSAPSSTKAMFGGGWESLSSESTKGSNGNSFSYDSSSIWRRRNEESTMDLPDEYDLRIVFTPSEDIEDVPIEKPRKSKNRNEYLNGMWKLLAFTLVVAFLTGHPGRVLHKFRVPSNPFGLSQKTKISAKPDVQRPFLNSSQNGVGAWLK
jgi:hypothetical protein